MISARFFLAGEQYTGCEISGNVQRLFAGLELQLGELSKVFPANIQVTHMEV